MIVKLQEVLSIAFEKEGIDPSLAVVVSSERPELGDLQCNGVRAAAGRSKQDPHALAERIISHIDHPEFAFKVTGPGFISITVMPEALERRISDKVEATLGSDRIVLDFGGPNIAKPMHIGHLRSLVIGDALQRILSFAGHEVISDIHLGDWGLQMGLLCASLEGTPLADITIELLERTYPMASARKDTDPEFRAKAEDYTLRLQKGDPELRTMWQRFVQVSMVEIERELSRLNITFTCYKGESDSNERITPTIERFMQHGPCEIEDGAVVVHATKPPLILRKSNGAALYATTDLATIWDRMETLEPDRIIYVTDERQQLHFKQVFAAAQAVDLAPASVLTHIWFGTINDSTGKPLKTRAGGVPKLVDVIEAAVAKAAERNPEVAEAVAIAALKFADLQNARTTSYNFDLNRFLSFEGKTGPYIALPSGADQIHSDESRDARPHQAGE